MFRKFSILLLVQAILLLSPGGVLSAELLVSAASSLTNGFQEVGAAFEKTHPGQKVIFNFAGSGTLLQQLDKGAPVDVLAAADQETMDKAQAKGLLLAGSRRDFAGNSLVLAVPLGGTVRIDTPMDLLKPEVSKIAVGDPGFVPAGRYGYQAMKSLGIEKSLASKLVLGANVRQVLNYVVRGEVDAGLIFASDAVVAKDKLRVVAVLDVHAPILYPVSVVSRSENQALALEFTEFLEGTEARGILEKSGFTAP